MKALITIVAACILTSCVMQSHCPTYAGTKRVANHKKSITPYAGNGPLSRANFR